MAGQIIERGKGVFLVRIFVGRDGGKRVYHNKTIHGTKKDAERYIRTTLTERDLGTLVLKKITVGTLLDDLLRDYKTNGKSLDWAQIVVGHLRPRLGAVLASRLSTEHIDRYIAQRKEKVSNGTINREMTILRRALNLGRMATPPKVTRVPRLPKLQEAPARKGFFEHDAFLAVRGALSEEIRPVFVFAYFTGCRMGEILALRWSQVDMTERVVRLEPGTTKNKDARMIPLTGELFAVLELQKQQHDQFFPASPWVFSRIGEPIRDFRGAWESACEKAGLWDPMAGKEYADGTFAGRPTKLFHDLRRTGVRNLVRAGVPERVAMMISGHRTRSVFDRYNIVDERDLKDAARKLGEYLGNKEIAQKEEVRTIGTHTENPLIQ